MVSVPSAEADSRSLPLPFPALPCRAFVFRAFGTAIEFGSTSPEGARQESPAWKCRVAVQYVAESRRACSERVKRVERGRHLRCERFHRIESQSGLADQYFKLGFERALAMVLRLVLDVVDDSFLV